MKTGVGKTKPKEEIYIKKVEKRVAHQFFIDKRSVEWLAETYKLSKSSVLYCITEWYQDFGIAIAVSRKADTCRVAKF